MGQIYQISDLEHFVTYPPIDKIIQALNNLSTNEVAQIYKAIFDKPLESLEKLSEDEIKKMWSRLNCEWDPLLKKELLVDLDYVKVINEFYKAGFICIGRGSGRRVFGFDNFVIKIPFNARGIEEMTKDLKTYQKYPEYFAKNNILLYKSTTLNKVINLEAMEKLILPDNEEDQMEIDLFREEIIDKVPKSMDWDQWGFSANGKIKAYDFF